jgi:hypothetical protein
MKNTRTCRMKGGDDGLGASNQYAPPKAVVEGCGAVPLRPPLWYVTGAASLAALLALVVVGVITGLVVYGPFIVGRSKFRAVMIIPPIDVWMACVFLFCIIRRRVSQSYRVRIIAWAFCSSTPDILFLKYSFHLRPFNRWWAVHQTTLLPYCGMMICVFTLSAVIGLIPAGTPGRTRR